MEALSNSLGSLRHKIGSRFYFDHGQGTAGTVFLASTGRSGSTWISDLINFKGDYRYIFEPFNRRYVPCVKHFRCRQYIPRDDQDVKYVRPARAILCGRIRNRWADKLNRTIVCKNRLIKDVRANMFLGWLKSNFPDICTILLFRHPCAVVASQIKLGWQEHLDEMLSDERLVRDFLGPFVDDIRSARDPFERHVFQWCIENYVALKQLRIGEAHLAFYEKFCEDSEKELRRLFSFIGIEYDSGALSVLSRPSVQTHAASAVATGGSLVDNWRQSITSSQIRNAVDILQLFGLDALYAEDGMPKTENARLLLGS